MGPGPRGVLQIFPYKLLYFNTDSELNTVELPRSLGLPRSVCNLRFYKGLEQILS